MMCFRNLSPQYSPVLYTVLSGFLLGSHLKTPYEKSRNAQERVSRVILLDRLTKIKTIRNTRFWTCFYRWDSRVCVGLLGIFGPRVLGFCGFRVLGGRASGAFGCWPSCSLGQPAFPGSRFQPCRCSGSRSYVGVLDLSTGCVTCSFDRWPEKSTTRFPQQKLLC